MFKFEGYEVRYIINAMLGCFAFVILVFSLSNCTIQTNKASYDLSAANKKLYYETMNKCIESGRTWKQFINGGESNADYCIAVVPTTKY